MKKLIPMVVLMIVIFGLICARADGSGISSETFAQKVTELREMFPVGAQWLDEYSEASQCRGWAFLAADHVFGGDARTWPVSYDINDVKKGDIVQYNEPDANGHTIFVLDVDGDNIIYADCNGNENYRRYDKEVARGKCLIGWDEVILKQSDMFGRCHFNYLFSSPEVIDNYAPSGWINAALGGEGVIHIEGSVWDPDAPGEPVELHLYVGGTYDTQDHCYIFFSDAATQTFKTSVTVSERGDQSIYLYAINKPAGDNPEIGRGTVTVVEPNNNQKPLMDFGRCNGEAGKINVRGWAFDPDDPERTLSVLFYAQNDQGELIPLGGLTADQLRSDVDKVHHCGTRHGFEGYVGCKGLVGTYVVHAVALDAQAGGDNATWMNKSNVTIAGETTKPTVSNVELKNITAQGYTISATVTDDSEVNTLQVATWCDRDASGNPVAVYKDAGRSGTTYSLRIERNASKRAYWSDLYAWDYYGNQTRLNLPCATVKWNTVTLDGRGGEVSPGSKAVICAFTNIDNKKTYFTQYGALPKPVREGYTFEGWYTAPTNGTKITNASNVTLTEDHTLYARWTANTYTVHLDPNGGAVGLKSLALQFGTPYGELPVPVREQSLFKGWFDEAGEQIQPSDTFDVAGDIVLTARWTIPDFVLPGDLTAIGEEAFAGGAFTFVWVPDGVTDIGSRAFANCGNLKVIRIPKNARVADDAFKNVPAGLMIVTDGNAAS